MLKPVPVPLTGKVPGGGDTNIGAKELEGELVVVLLFVFETRRA
jgi:methylglyoxal synthase